MVFRVIFGGFVYFSDYFGEGLYNFEFIKKFVFFDGIVLRCIYYVFFIRDFLFKNFLFDKELIFKIFNFNKVIILKIKSKCLLKILFKFG